MASLISETVRYVKQTLANAEAGHDWFHIQRVYRNALYLHKHEGGNLEIIQLAALLHDIADSKFHKTPDGTADHELGPQKAAAFMRSQNVAPEVIHEVVQIIRCMSFSMSFETQNYHSKELEIVQDADRLDAIGAIGIARAFHYGGYKNRVMFDPLLSPQTFHSKEAYQKSEGTTINHFYEKLLLLKHKINTPTAKTLADERHRFMEQFLGHFYTEWSLIDDEILD